MRVIISSKLLASKLNQFDFETDHIIQVCASKDCLHVVSKTKEVEINCHIDSEHYTLPQHNRRWEHIKSIVNRVEEQPIVLLMTEAGNKVIFEH